VLGFIAVAIVTFAGSVGLHFARDASSDAEIQRLTENAYNRRRPGGGRLAGAAYTPREAADSGETAQPDSTALARAQILLLLQPDSPKRRALQGQVYLAAGEWRKFIDLTESSPQSDSAATANNLGVSYLALSSDDAPCLIKALEAFQDASRMDPGAAEPLFNLVLVYRMLRFSKLAEETLHRYSNIDARSPWLADLLQTPDNDKALAQLQETIQHRRGDAERLFLNDPMLYRYLAMQQGLSGELEQPDALRFVADQTVTLYQDRTIAAMLAPLFTTDRDATLALRRTVKEGAKRHTEGKFAEALQLYSQAEQLAEQTQSTFDRVWVQVNKADTQIRMAQFKEGGGTVSKVIAIAEENDLPWIKAKALSLYGSTLRLTSTYSEMLDRLAEADTEFIRIGTPQDRIRVLYYLAIYRHMAGDQDEALKFAVQCLRLIDDSDRVRISTLDWLLGSILYRRGMTEESLIFAQEAVEQSRGGPYANGIEFVASSTLAEFYEDTSNPKRAEEFLRIAEQAFEKVPEGDRIRAELILGIAKAKTKISQKRYEEAEALLQRNLNIYFKQPFQATPMLSQSLMLLAGVYAEIGRNDDAARNFADAIDVVEKDDEYLKSEVLRIKFDDERRNLYDSAIAFEFNHGSPDSAWTDLQSYRAKLFLEFLAAFNPNIQTVRGHLNRLDIQRRIPKDTQIVEYALLKDRLLIWVVSDKLFTTRSVAVGRAEIESKVRAVLQKLRAEEDVDGLLVDLGTILIDPVAEVLDPNRTLTIIPDRALHGLPFGALKKSGTMHYLIQDFGVVISPSLTHFLTTKAARPVRDSIVGFGSQNGGASEFKELTALGQIYTNASTFVGHDVNKPAFLDGLSNSHVFHYAGHSATDAADPLRSSILLDGNRSGPNSVTAVDISQQRLPDNAVVILSSCDSSVGNSRDGIGVRGLTSAFLVGGAGSVVGSLWPVEASSTADLMIRFHRAFAKSGLPVAISLREAQLAFLKAFPEKSHPYYWSGFVVTGNLSALR
jgi:CHAT domain-containing protein